MFNLKKGNLYVVSAPSGAGKTILCKIIRKQIPKLVYSVSYTTRRARMGEVNTIDYFFVSKKKFKSMMLKGEYLEWAKVHGNYYGTPISFLERHINIGNDVLLDLDVNAVKYIMKGDHEVTTIFIMPPSLEILEKRLYGRRTDNIIVVKERMKNAVFEVKKKDLFQYIIVNNNFYKAIKRFMFIFKYNLKSELKFHIL